MRSLRLRTLVLLFLVSVLALTACTSAATPTVLPNTNPGTAPTSTASSRSTTTATSSVPATVTARSSTPASTTTAQGTATRAGGTPAATASRTTNPYGLQPGQGSSIDAVQITRPVTISFWHAQPPGVRDQELQRLIADFQRRYPQITVKAEYQGGTLFNKVRAAAVASGAPDLITATDDQLTEYRAADLLAPLNDYANSRQYGLSNADLADYYPAYFQATIQQGQVLALPFAKTVLALYYNADKLREAGVSVPETWDDFLTTCKRFTGNTKGYAISINASSFFAMLYSRGGQPLNDNQTAWQFNQASGQEQLSLLQALINSGCAYLVDKKFGDQSDFGAGNVVFTIDQSSGFSYYQDLVNGGGKFTWGLAPLPHAAGVAPATTQSGSNLTVLRTTPERQLAAWLFARYLTETEATASWAAKTGYLPVRQSALNTPVMVQQLAAQPGYRVAVTTLPAQARPEPVVRGTTETRKLLEDTLFIALTEPTRPANAQLDDAAQKGNAALQTR